MQAGDISLLTHTHQYEIVDFSHIVLNVENMKRGLETSGMKILASCKESVPWLELVHGLGTKAGELLGRHMAEEHKGL